MSSGDRGRAHLVDIVAEFTLSDGPWLLMMPLESSYLGSHNRSAPISIVVHAPVVYTSQKVCTNPECKRDFLH